MNGIANILKRQDEVKNGLLRVANLQSDKRRSRTSYEAIGKPESVENFRQTDRIVLRLLDSISIELNVISELDSAVFRKNVNSSAHYGNHLKLLSLMATVIDNSTLYDTSFAALVFSGKPLDSMKYVETPKVCSSPRFSIRPTWS